jgi:hypothetical protein
VVTGSSDFADDECVCDVALSAWWKSASCGVTTHEAEGNCVTVRLGGEQPEAKG